MERKFSEIRSLVEVLGLDFSKFSDKPSKTGGARLRASLLVVKKLCDTLRKEVLQETKLIPTRSRPIKIPVGPPKPLKRSDSVMPEQHQAKPE